MKNALLFLVFSLWFAGVHAQVCPQPFKVVVLGSSTSVGTGASPTSNSYVALLRSYLQTSVNAGCQVINLAVGATTTYNIQPSSFTPPSPFTVDPAKNIEAAVVANPDAILINFPSNDAANSIPIETQKANFTRVVDYATDHNVPVWITSTQPRDNFSQAQRNMLIEMRDWLQVTFGNKYIDFWTGLAQPDGRIEPAYNYDNIHLNNAGHAILFDRVKNSSLITEVCDRVLPITFSDFKLKAEYENVLLTWDASHLEPATFVIQYSKSGTSEWTNAGEVNVNPNGQSAGSFSYLHSNAVSISTVLFYRIAAVHLNGNTIYSDTQRIQLETPKIPYTVHGANNQIIIRRRTTKNLHYILYDINGKIIEKNTLSSDLKIIPIVSGGIYILKIKDESGRDWIKKVSL